MDEFDLFHYLFYYLCTTIAYRVKLYNHKIVIIVSAWDSNNVIHLCFVSGVLCLITIIIKLSDIAY
jgi:hypothetical protein